MSGRHVSDSRVLIIGGRLPLRRAIGRELRHAGYTVSEFARTEHASVGGVTAWTGDVLTGAGLAVALDHADVAVSLSRYDGAEDTAARVLGDALTRSRIRHMVALSDVAAGALPTRRSQAVMRMEQRLSNASTPVTFIRAAVTHQRLHQLRATHVGRRRLEMLRDVLVEPVDEADLAPRFADTVREPGALRSNIIGPERLAIRALLFHRRHVGDQPSSRLSEPLRAALDEQRHLATGTVLVGRRRWQDSSAPTDGVSWRSALPPLF
jgi:hypothetical protein